MEPEEERRLEFVFNMYATNSGVIDAADVIEAMYGLQLSPTKQIMVKTVGTDQRKVKYINFDGFCAIYKKLKSHTDQGGFHDFVECLKSFDLKENGTVKYTELDYLLRNLGEGLSNEELDKIFEGCMLEEEDDEGYIPYLPFICRLCDQPVPPGYKEAPVEKLEFE